MEEITVAQVLSRVERAAERYPAGRARGRGGPYVGAEPEGPEGQ